MNIQSWLGQATTGVGFSTILATIGAVGGGALGWKQALPILVGGAASLIWPENGGAQETVQQAAIDAATLAASVQSNEPPQPTSSGAPVAPAH